MRDTKGRPVKPDDRKSGTKPKDDDKAEPSKKTVSRVGEKEGAKSSSNIKDKTGPGSPKEVSGDPENNPDARKNAEAFDKHEERLQEHHDRLETIEKVLGKHHWADNFHRQDQSLEGGKATGGHVTVKKGAQYGRKRH